MKKKPKPKIKKRKQARRGKFGKAGKINGNTGKYQNNTDYQAVI